MTTHATPDDIERARPTGTGDRRWTGDRGAGRWVAGTAAVNAMPATVAVPRPAATWWQPIIDGLWHAWRAHELCDEWDRDDLADAVADQLWAEAQRLTTVTEELVTVPAAAVAAVARIRRGK